MLCWDSVLWFLRRLVYFRHSDNMNDGMNDNLDRLLKVLHEVRSISMSVFFDLLHPALVMSHNI